MDAAAITELAELPHQLITLLPSSSFAIEGAPFTLALTRGTITGAVWTKDGGSIPFIKAPTAGGGATDTFVTFDALDLDDAGEYCVTGTSEGDEVDECYNLSVDDIAKAGSSVPVGRILGLTVLSILIAFAGMQMLRRRQLS